MSRIDITFRLPATYELDEVTGLTVAHCPALDVYSQGETYVDATRALSSAIRMFLTISYKNGSFGRVLERHGFAVAEDVAGLWTGGYVEVTLRLESQEPAHG